MIVTPFIRMPQLILREKLKSQVYALNECSKDADDLVEDGLKVAGNRSVCGAWLMQMDDAAGSTLDPRLANWVAQRPPLPRVIHINASGKT